MAADHAPVSGRMDKMQQAIVAVWRGHALRSARAAKINSPSPRPSGLS
jgi:hypothetical protein